MNCCASSQSWRNQRHRIFTCLLSLLVLTLCGCGQPEVEVFDVGGVDINTGDNGGNVTPQDVVDGKVAGDECITDYDCKDAKGKTPCGLPKCTDGYCGWTPKSSGSKCTDPSLEESACEQARCSDSGECKLIASEVGASCQSSGNVGECEAATCDKDKQCKVAPKADEVPCGLGTCGNWCEAGTCVVAPDTAYDDGNPCTKDYCSQNTEVVHEPITAAIACDDGDPCSGDGTCKEGKCFNPASDNSCNDGIPCTVDSCGKDGCKHKGDDSKCTDGDACFNYKCDEAKGCQSDGAKKGEKCDDGDKCTTGDVCDDKGVCAGPTNTCKCNSDADCDTTDKCLPRFCDATTSTCAINQSQKVECDGSNDGPCAQNACDPTTGACAIVALNEGKDCDDNSVCTSKTTCTKGECIGASDKKCDDGNICTTDQCEGIKGCDFVPTAGVCDDNNPCTDNDGCDNGGCVGLKKPCDDGVACTFDSCDKATGKCVNTAKDKNCDDGNPCTNDVCDAAKGCQNSADDAAKCEDEDKCTITGCSAGQCVVKSLDKNIAGCGCAANSECDDNNPCTEDTCDKGDCKFNGKPLDGKECLGPNLCIEGMICTSGTCGGGKPKACDDKNPCTNDTCSAKTGKCNAQNKADGTQCDADGSLCTSNDACDAGKCTPGVAKDCSAQGDACNLASCDAKTGKCQSNPAKSGVDCDDGKYCTVKDTCDGKGKCVAGKARDCAASGDTCNAGICDEKAGGCGKKPKASGTACDDGQYCTVNNKCDDKGSCGGGQPRTCSDDVAKCKLGTCDETTNKCGFKSASNGANCDDGNKCTQSDKCDAKGVCKGGSLKLCSSDQCNDGICDSKTGSCGLAPKKAGTKCNDSNLCTQLDTCSKGKCIGSDTKSCAGDACNNGVCQAKTGLCTKQPKKDGTACTDGQSCTKPDLCKSGKCLPGPWTCQCQTSKDCDDKNQCTKDTCSIGKCFNLPSFASSCSDGDSCTTGDSCKTGVCKGSPKNCDDKNACTADSCAKGICQNKALSGFKCSDGNACTFNDKCSSLGKCAGTSVLCNDGKSCTDDKCVGGVCKYTNDNKNFCSDGNPCTLSDYCSSGKCYGGKSKACSDSTKCTSNYCDAKTGLCASSAAYNGSTCENGAYSVCDNKSCKCRVWTAKTSNSGTTYLRGIAPTSDGGSIAVGYESVSGNGYDSIMIRRDKYGVQKWKVYVKPTKNNELLYKVTRLKNSNEFMAVGYRYYNSTYGNVGWVVRFDINGKILSEATILLYKNAQAHNIVWDGGSYVYVTGEYSLNGYSTPYVRKYEVTGKYLKQRVVTTFGSKKSSYSRGITYGGGYVYIGGYTTATKYGGSYDGFITKLDTNLTEKATYKYGSSGTDYFYGLIYNGGYIWAAGMRYLSSTKTSNDGWLVKISSTGYAYVNKSFARSAGKSETDRLYSLAPYGSGVIAVGDSYDSVNKKIRGWVLRVSSSATTTYTNLAFGSTSYTTLLYDVVSVSGSSYYGVAGYTSNSSEGTMTHMHNTGNDWCTIKIIKPPVLPGF